MKKNYHSPKVIMESFSVTEQASSCAAVQISSTDAMCVIQDADSTPGMIDFAFFGGFLYAQNCKIPVPEMDPEGGDGLCYHTSVAMVFTS